MTILIGNNKSNTANTNYRIIFSIIIGLLFSFSSQIVFAQSTSASAAVDKGGGQIVNTTFGPLSFVQIQQHPQRADILKKLPEDIYDTFEDWMAKGKQAAIEANKGILETLQAAIEANKGKLETLQAAIKEGEKIDAATQAAINKVIAQIPQVIPLYESDVQQGKKLSQKDKSRLEYVLGLRQPPEWMPRVKKLLANPQNFVDSAPR